MECDLIKLTLSPTLEEFDWCKKLRLRELVIKTDWEIRLRKLDLEAQMLRSKLVPLPRARPPSSSSEFGKPDFDIDKYYKLVSPFRETDVDSYFVALNRSRLN